MRSEHNWAGNYRYSAGQIHYPESVDEVRGIMARSAKVKALGSRHSFNGIADSEGDLISLARFEDEITIDSQSSTATISGNVTYGRLCPVLHGAGFALPNMASLPHISVAGACATATHGSGNANRILAASVSALELVTANGDVKTLTRSDSEFHGVLVGMGGFGIITRLSLDLIPAFTICQEVYESIPVRVVCDEYETITESAYSVSLFTDWQDAVFDQAWLKRRTDSASGPEFPWGRRAETPLHPVRSFSAACCTDQMGVPGSWQERLPHFRLEHTPSCGDELQSEYFVPRESAPAALRAIAELKDILAPALLISEIRTIAADEFWMSPCFRRPSAAIHFTWGPDWGAVKELLPRIEEVLSVYECRPHWGKLFTMSPIALQSRYPKLANFRELLRELDAERKFGNAFLEAHVYERKM